MIRKARGPESWKARNSIRNSECEYSTIGAGIVKSRRKITTEIQSNAEKEMRENMNSCLSATFDSPL
jgi:hypothetical protein